MKLLTATYRYYLPLAALLFGLGALVLYGGLQWALRQEVADQLRDQQARLLAYAARTGHLPPAPPGAAYARRPPRPSGLRDTVQLDALEGENVPYRQLTFRVREAAGPRWVTLGKSLLETNDVLAVVLSVLLVVLSLLFVGLLLLNRWLSGRLWAPFQQTLAALRAYTQPHRQALVLPATQIDEFRELHQALTYMSARLETEYRALREFTENAAHETRTPLAIMQARLEQLMQRPEIGPAAAPLVGDLYVATLRLARLYQALTLLSKLENRQFPAAAPLDLARLLTTKLDQLADPLAAKQLRVELRAPPTLLLPLHPALADSLLNNLLQNAIKHNQPGGRLRVALTPRALQISNSGPPVAGDPARFFGRFQKQHPDSDSPGLGLAIVQHICQYYGFAIAYTYAPATGLHTLTVTLAGE